MTGGFASPFIALDTLTPGTGFTGCQDAPLVCDLSELDGFSYYTGFTGVGPCPPPFCGSCENSQWFAFRAEKPNIHLRIVPSNCQGQPNGTGLQAQLYYTINCNNFVPVSSCESPSVSIPLNIIANDLVPGDAYYLMIDGWAGDNCDYSIYVLDGMEPAPAPLIPGPITGPALVVTGQEAMYAAPSGDGVSLYEWTITPALGVVSGNGNPEISIAFDQTGEAQLCVTPSNACETGAQVCMTIVAAEPLNDCPVIAGEVTGVSCVYEQDGAIQLDIAGGTPPYSILWSTGSTAQSISGLAPGTYSVLVTDANGCPENQTTFSYAGPATPLPDGTGETIILPLEISGFPSGAIFSSELFSSNICITIEHSWMRDLEISLECPSGAGIILHNLAGQTGGEVFLGEPYELDEGLPPLPGTGYTYCWVETGATHTWIQYANEFMPQTLPAGDYLPFNSLSGLDGCPLNGEWKLKIQDLWAADNGYVFGWDISFEGFTVDSFVVETSTADCPVCLTFPLCAPWLRDTIMSLDCAGCTHEAYNALLGGMPGFALFSHCGADTLRRFFHCDGEPLGGWDPAALTGELLWDCSQPLPSCQGTPPWEPVACNSGIAHTVVLLDTLQSQLAGETLETGDVVGFFFTGSDGQAVCSQYAVWEGTTLTFDLCGDDPATPDVKEGYSDGEALQIRVWKNAAEYPVTACYLPENFYGLNNPNAGGQFESFGLSYIDCLQYGCYELALVAGVNFVSIPIIPLDPAIEVLFPAGAQSPIAAIENQENQAYSPLFGTDPGLFGEWDFRKAYRIKALAPATVEVCGTPAPPDTPIEYAAQTPQGLMVHNWTAYLKDTAALVGGQFSAAQTPDIFRVWNMPTSPSGNLAPQSYLPLIPAGANYEMDRGRGYILNASGDGVFTYNFGSEAAEDRGFGGQPGVCGAPYNTFFSANIFFDEDLDATADGAPLPQGSHLIAVFGEDECAGFAAWEGASGLMVVNGDDGALPGYTEGEPYRFLVQLPDGCVLDSVEVTFEETGIFGPGEFHDGGFSKLKSLHAYSREWLELVLLMPAGADGCYAEVVPAGGIPPYTYLWSGGETDSLVFSLPNGAFSVTVTDSQGCEAVASGECLINDVSESAFPGSWRVYPNPSAGVFFMEVELAQAENFAVEVHNALGQVVWRREVSGASAKLEIDLAQQGAGVYWVVVEKELEFKFRSLLILIP